MYCSISCSRACRSPCSWYRRRRALSFSATAGHLLRQPHPLAVDVHVLHGRVEDAPDPEALSGLTLDLVEQPRGQRPDEGLELAVEECHPDGDVTRGRIGLVEDRVERDLQVLEVLHRQVEPNSEAAEHEVRHAMEL